MPGAQVTTGLEHVPGVPERVAPRIARVGYPFDSGSHKMLWSRESIYQEANPEVTALARRGAA